MASAFNEDVSKIEATMKECACGKRPSMWMHTEGQFTELKAQCEACGLHTRRQIAYKDDYQGIMVRLKKAAKLWNAGNTVDRGPWG